MRDRPAIPHRGSRRIKQLAMVVLSGTADKPRLRRPPGKRFDGGPCVAYGAELYAAVTLLRAADGLLLPDTTRRAGSQPALCR